MPSVSPQFSVTVRVELDARQEPLGKLTASIAESGGSLQGVDLVPGAGEEGKRVREFTIDARDQEHWEQIMRRRVSSPMPGHPQLSARRARARQEPLGKLTARSPRPAGRCRASTSCPVPARREARARVHDRRPRPGALGADHARDRLDARGAVLEYTTAR